MYETSVPYGTVTVFLVSPLIVIDASVGNGLIVYVHIVGSRVTSLARCHLMRLIRESTNNDPKHKFIYCDTDSLKILNEVFYFNKRENLILVDDNKEEVKYKQN